MATENRSASRSKLATRFHFGENLGTILFCDFNFRSSLFRRLHYFSMFGFDSALPQPLESSHPR